LANVISWAISTNDRGLRKNCTILVSQAGVEPATYRLGGG